MCVHRMLKYVCASVLCVCVCVCVLLKGKMHGGCTMGTPGPDTSETIRRSPLSFLFDFLLAMQSSWRRHRQEVLHHCMMDKWAGRLKTQGENVRIHSLIYFRLWKYTHADINTDTLRMLCFLPFATSESDIFTCCVLLLFFFFEYLSLPFRSQTNLFCGCMTWEKATAVYTGECKAAPLTKYCLYTNPQPSELT